MHAGKQRDFLPLGRSRRQQSPGARSSTAWRKGLSPGGPGGEASGNDPHFRCHWRSRSAKPNGFSTYPPPPCRPAGCIPAPLLPAPAVSWPRHIFSYVSHLQIQGMSFKNILASSAWFDQKKCSSANSGVEWILGSLPEQMLSSLAGGLGFPWEIDSLKPKYLQLWQNWLFVSLNKLKQSALSPLGTRRSISC